MSDTPRTISPTDLDAIVSGDPDGTLGVEAHLELDRTRWGIL